MAKNAEKIDKMQYTPMMRQYLTIKEEHPETLIMFRLGDFYELFFDDALVASHELEITLTGRDAGAAERVPMCGVPYHAVNGYINALTAKGYKVGIVDQLEAPGAAPGIVKRGLTRIITPGTIIDDGLLDAKANNYLAALTRSKTHYFLSYIDLSTGDGYLTQLPLAEAMVFAELVKLETKELVLAPEIDPLLFKKLTQVYDLRLEEETSEELPDYWQGLVAGLKADEKRCYSILLNYIRRTQLRTLAHLKPAVYYLASSFMRLDSQTRRNLELTANLQTGERKNSLFGALDLCKTALGSRYLKHNIMFPLLDRAALEARYDVVERLREAYLKLPQILAALGKIYDLERLIGRISYNNATPKDLLMLRHSLAASLELAKLTAELQLAEAFPFSETAGPAATINELLFRALADDAPATLRQGGVIKAGYSAELDRLRAINTQGDDYIFKLEAAERKRTGINQLKIKYNKVFGYFIEVSKANSALIKPEFGYIRKQTLVNAERYITPELKAREVEILRASQEALDLEAVLFGEIRVALLKDIAALQARAELIARLDMLAGFAQLARKYKYTRPVLNPDGRLEIKAGKHPVLSQLLPDFIANSTHLAGDDIVIITGPNMSGKSTYMRQVGLIAIMAQIGSFVPAQAATLPVFDAIYTRIGAADDLISGQSTFLVEMLEVNTALSQATPDSLLLFDEIGRGTATYDGMALAQAIIEYVATSVRAKTLFSTHYHALTNLQAEFENIHLEYVAVAERAGEIVFLHEVKPGAIGKSYGVNVASLAGLPEAVILRAKDLLEKMTAGGADNPELLSIKNYQPPLVFDSKTPAETAVLEELAATNLYELTPLAALNLIEAWQRKVKKGKNGKN